MLLSFAFHGFQWEMHSILNHFFLCITCCFCIATFSIFSLFLVFSGLVIMYLRMVFFGLILFRTCWVLCICKFMSFTKFGMLLVIMSWNTLSPFLLGHQWPFHIVPEVRHTVLVFVLFFSSLFLRSEIFYQFDFTFKFYWGHPVKKNVFKISDVLLFSSKTFTWFFFIIFIFLLKTFFPSFLKVCTCTSCMVILTVALNSLKSLIIPTSEWTLG